MSTLANVVAPNGYAPTAAERAKLSTVQNGATANASDDFLRDLANAVGELDVAKVTGLLPRLQGLEDVQIVQGEASYEVKRGTGETLFKVPLATDGNAGLLSPDDFEKIRVVTGESTAYAKAEAVVELATASFEDVQAAIDASVAASRPLAISPAGHSGGVLETSSGLHVKGSPKAVFAPTQFSKVGAFLTNVRFGDKPGRVQSDLVFENVYIDLRNLPAPLDYAVTAVSGDTITIGNDADGNPPPTDDDAFDGLLAEIATGGQAGKDFFALGYDGTTKVVTLDKAHGAAVGDVFRLGRQDNGGGLADGASNVLYIGGRVWGHGGKNAVGSSKGDKGDNFEANVTNACVIGRTYTGLTSAMFAQGKDLNALTGDPQRSVGIRFIGNHADTCGSVVTFAGIDSSKLPDGDSNDSMMLADGNTYENAGHMPWRIVSSDKQKSGVFNLLEAQNVSLTNNMGRNDADYPPAFVADYPSRCGAGLTGPVGAWLWGHGRNVYAANNVHHGDLDVIIHLGRGRAFGDDAGPTGRPGNCFEWRLRDIVIHGDVQHAIRIDGNSLFRVPADEFTGHLELTAQNFTSGIVDPNMAAFEGVTLRIHEMSSDKTVIGTPKQIIAGGNDFASLPDGATDYVLLTQENAVALKKLTSSVQTAVIAAGAVAVNDSATVLLLDTEGSASVDNLANITGDLWDGRQLLLRPVHNDRTVNLLDDAGNIDCGGTLALNHTSVVAQAICFDGKVIVSAFRDNI